MVPTLGQIGWLYQNGCGVEQNYSQSMSWYRWVVQYQAGQYVPIASGLRREFVEFLLDLYTVRF
jgi:TPR repeat protein